MRTVFVLGLVSLLAGCIPERNTVTRSFNPSKGKGKLIDAQQRAIISVRRDVIGSDGRPLIDEKNERVTDLVVCAEPSPDALQATATALSGQLSDKALDALLNFSGSTAESAAFIGLRTQTIQLLRDAYFRLCEGYLNDGLDAIAYDILQRRFQSQIVALLAVEQLTGAVKAQQVAHNTSAASDAGAQASLIAGMLEDAEEELLNLQEEKAENAAELRRLEEEKPEATTTDGTESEQAATDTTDNVDKIEAAKRKDASIDKQIERRKKFIATLEESFTAAAQATVKSSARGVATFGDDGSMTNQSSMSDVANAVRAITLNAINQDYEAQVCFESLRYRNNVAQFRNNVNDAFDSAGLNDRLEGRAFLEYCESLFDMQADLRSARVGLVEVYGSTIQTVVNSVDKGAGGISASDAAGLLLALSEAVPTVPGAAFLKRKLEIERAERSESDGDGGDKCIDKPGCTVNIGLENFFTHLLPESSKPAAPAMLEILAELDDLVLIPKCKPGKKLNAGRTECVDRCIGEDLQYDKASDECVRKTPGRQNIK